jgi:ribulose-phosphate 3-epimerase
MVELVIKNIYELKDAGVDVVVAGSYIYGSDNYADAIKIIANLI